MTSPPLSARWSALLLLAAGLALLYLDALSTGFLNDDYLFLEEARGRPLLESLGRLGALGNYYRPLSRQLWFATLAPAAGGEPWVFHAASALLFAGALMLLLDLLRALLPWPGALAGTLYFAVLPLQRVNLTWISCSQDLLALLLALAAFALWRRRRVIPAALAFLGACASKEAALPLPAALVAWGVWIERRTLGESLRRAAPMVALAVGWGALALALALRHPVSAGTLHFRPGTFALALVHGLQSLLGLEHPPGLLPGMIEQAPALLPLVLIGAIALAWPRRAAAAAASVPGATSLPPARRVAAFALCWLVAFALVTGPVAAIWSGYFYTLTAVAGAILLGLPFRRADRWTWLGLSAVLLWWHAGASAVRAFAVEENPFIWTSHLTAAYFQRAAGLTRGLSHELRSLEPSLPRGARLFFAELPPYAGFQMGNGALVRTLYRDPTLESYFYSQFSESTAADRPCRFIYWDGAALKTLYRNASDPFFQVGSDLLLLDRPAGAAHAFRRALAEGGSRADNLYFLGWAELWRGHRDAAEAAWTALGAKDDSVEWAGRIADALEALDQRRDTLRARRELARAVNAGIGRPEAHALLGELLLARQPKYAMLELKVATALNPADWASRRLLLDAMLGGNMEAPAARELEELARQRPELEGDSRLIRARARLAPRARVPVVEF